MRTVSTLIICCICLSYAIKFDVKKLKSKNNDKLLTIPLVSDTDKNLLNSKYKSDIKESNSFKSLKETLTTNKKVNTTTQIETSTEYKNNNPISSLHYARPTIAVVTEWQPSNTDKKITKSWMFSNTFDWITENNVNLIPLFPWYSMSETFEILNYSDGIVFMGGMRTYKQNGEFENYYKSILEYSKKNYIPILSICQGYQFLMNIEADENILSDYKNDISVFTPDYFVKYDKEDYKTLTNNITSNKKDVKDNLFKYLEIKDVLDFESKKVNYHYHKYGITVEEFFSHDNLKENYVISSIGKDRENKEFINSVYHKNYPIHAVQYHPERGNKTAKNKNLGEDYNSSRDIASLIFKGFISILEKRQESKPDMYQVNDAIKQRFYELNNLEIDRTFNEYYKLKGYTFNKLDFKFNN